MRRYNSLLHLTLGLRERHELDPSGVQGRATAETVLLYFNLHRSPLLTAGDSKLFIFWPEK